MGKNTRYDRFRDRIRRRFSRSTTFTPAIAFGESELIFDLSNVENVGNDEFLENGPFNYVSVRNTADANLRVYLSNDLQTYIDVQGTTGSPNNRIATERIPRRYVSYLRIENLSPDTDVTEGDVQVQVGNEVDSVELDLLKMSGLLNVSDETEN